MNIPSASLLTRQEVITLPLAPGVRTRLLAAGYSCISDLEHVQPQQLATIVGITLDEAAEVLLLARSQCMQGLTTPAAVTSHTAAQLLAMEETQAPVIPTLATALDDMLGSGVACGHVTEFCGVPGVGKTQLGIQLAVNVQVPSVLGGVGGAAIYIDTEGSFMVDRVRDIAEGTRTRVAQYAAAQAEAGVSGAREAAQAFTLEHIMSNIFHFRIHKATEQLALVAVLKPFLLQHPNASRDPRHGNYWCHHWDQVKLVVVDSVTFHFRQDFRDMGTRTRVLTGMAQDLMALAESFGLAVVLMNQVATRVSGEGVSRLVPALGESWGQAASTRVILHWERNVRHAFLHKSPCLPQATVAYAVTEEGVRDVQPAL